MIKHSSLEISNAAVKRARLKFSNESVAWALEAIHDINMFIARAEDIKGIYEALGFAGECYIDDYDARFPKKCFWYLLGSVGIKDIDDWRDYAAELIDIAKSTFNNIDNDKL